MSKCKTKEVLLTSEKVHNMGQNIRSHQHLNIAVGEVAALPQYAEARLPKNQRQCNAKKVLQHALQTRQ
jgi:hypothetical protein